MSRRTTSLNIPLRQYSTQPATYQTKVAPFPRPRAARPLSCTVPRKQEERNWSTPLAKTLYETTGPVPLASYMRMCLTADQGSYYAGTPEDAARQPHDQFGVHGDFVTSPEISQVFGELVGIWFVAEWMSQGRPRQGVELIEVGPGRGTLMDDMLRTFRNFPELAHAIDAIYMVEASPRLREQQKTRLCGPDAPMTESRAGYHSICRNTNLPIVWTETIKSIPIDARKTPFIVAHEFFDALPIHVFQSVEVAPTAAPPASDASDTSKPPAVPTDETVRKKPALQWRELVVSPTPPHADLLPGVAVGAGTPEFQLTLSRTPTRHSQYLPESSPRYRKLKSTQAAVIEVCPDGWLYAADFASRIGGSRKHPKPTPSGAALVIDYGMPDTVPVNSLRGIRNHRRVSPFSDPGLVDLSADVDFTSLADATTRASEGVEVHGPVSQGDFLQSLGIRERAERLGSRAKLEGKNVEAIDRAWKRLVDRGPGGMGKVYHALAILPENKGRRKPVGFGGDVD